MEKELGRKQAKRLRRRLDDLAAAASLEVMKTLPGRTHELKADRKGQLSMDLEHPRRLVFEPTGDYSNRPDGGLDWATVTAIRILEITDTHE